MNTSPSFDIAQFFNQIRQLEIHTPQGLSGLLTKESRYVFNYGRIRDNAAVSLVMPVREESYASGDLMGVFAMNRPEGYLRYILEERLKRLGAPSDMFLLFLAGSHQIGRLTYTLPGEPLPQSTGERLEELLSSPSGPLFERLVDQYALGSGISGVQPKTLVPLALSDANCEPAEHTAMPLKTLIVARFDRTPEGAVLGFEDMAVLTGRTTRQKYEGSYEMIARAVDLFSGEARTVQLRKLFERVALSCWMRDGDAHLKNFGMLYEHPMAPRRLAPVYDVVCTDVYPDLDREMALKLNKRKTYPTRAELVQYGQRSGYTEDEASAVLNRIENAYATVMVRCEKDARYQNDPLLSGIRQAVERPALKAHQALRLG